MKLRELLGVVRMPESMDGNRRTVSVVAGGGGTLLEAEVTEVVLSGSGAVIEVAETPTPRQTDMEDRLRGVLSQLEPEKLELALRFVEGESLRERRHETS